MAYAFLLYLYVPAVWLYTDIGKKKKTSAFKAEGQVSTALLTSQITQKPAALSTDKRPLSKV